MESLQYQESNKTKRIEYIDALRGFTIILVIYAHVVFSSYGENGGSLESFSFNDIFLSFRMPLFFFISGFVFLRKIYLKQYKVFISF